MANHAMQTIPLVVAPWRTAMAGEEFGHLFFVRSLNCNLSGPGFRISDFESNRIIGTAQFQGAQTIMNGPLSSVSGTVKSVHINMNMFVVMILPLFYRHLTVHSICLFVKDEPFVRIDKWHSRANMSCCNGLVSEASGC